MVVREDLHHEHARQVFLRVGPVVRIEDAAPGVSPNRRDIVGLTSLRQYAEAQPESVAMIWKRNRHFADLILCHRCDGFGLQDANAFEFTTVQQHLQEPQVIARRCEKPATS